MMNLPELKKMERTPTGEQIVAWSDRVTGRLNLLQEKVDEILTRMSGAWSVFSSGDCGDEDETLGRYSFKEPSGRVKKVFACFSHEKACEILDREIDCVVFVIDPRSLSTKVMGSIDQWPSML